MIFPKIKTSDFQNFRNMTFIFENFSKCDVFQIWKTRKDSFSPSDDTLFNDSFECVFNYASSGGGTLLTGRAALKGMFFRPLKVHCKG